MVDKEATVEEGEYNEEEEKEKTVLSQALLTRATTEFFN